VDQFENALLRLRDLSLRVVDESAGGQDVSEEYVDLQSRLNNLESTRDRIRGFLDQAQTVDDSLRINQELSTIEDQIEQVKGRMNYLSHRAAYSTITVQ
jgi:predicted  nucleic acid-binding Zn-ribbon protein